ncbi:MAG: ATP-binding cassette domain-containing protein [Spirochaetaceae bacterium]|nr:MAG: ATP-binding cassette domain-containing protein [Spirochaetaceae bacterium]
MSTEQLFRVESLRFYYDAQLAVRLPVLEIKPGGITVLVGANGSGKTTLLKLLNGLLPVSEGRILYHGQPLCAEILPRLRRETVLVHQDPYLFDGTVYANVSYGLRLRRRPAHQVRRAVSEALSGVGLEGFEHRRARRLSGGERQRIAIARALVLDPKVLFLDEPTANVDAGSIELLERLILRLADRGTTIIFSSHHPAFAYRLGTHLIFLQEGMAVPGRDNIFKGAAEKTDERFTYFRTGTQILHCPAQEGQFLTAVLPLDDVILSEGQIHTSAQNQFHGKVTRLEKVDHTVRVSLDCGFPVQALITEYSVDTLKVMPGKQFYVTFKASAIRLY